MQIGDEVRYDGRRSAVVGFTPLSVTPFRVEVHYRETNETLSVEWPPATSADRAALRLVSAKKPAATE